MRTDETTPPARQDLEVLLDHVAGLARGQVEARGTLLCCGAYLGRDGGITNVVVEPPEDRSGVVHLEDTRRALGSVPHATAAALAVDLTLGTPTDEGMVDAIVVELDHRAPEEAPVRVVIPYRRRRRRGVRFGRMTAEAGEGIFPAPA